jgi:hypothetical protein
MVCKKKFTELYTDNIHTHSMDNRFHILNDILVHRNIDKIEIDYLLKDAREMRIMFNEYLPFVGFFLLRYFGSSVYSIS